MGHGSKRSKSLANKSTTSEKRITPNNKTLITKDTLNAKMKTSGNSTQPPNLNPIDVGLLERLQPDQTKTSTDVPPRRSRRHTSHPTPSQTKESVQLTHPQAGGKVGSYSSIRTWGLALTIAIGLFFSIGSGGQHKLVKRSLQFLPDASSAFHTQSSSQSSDGPSTTLGSDTNPKVEDIKQPKVGVTDPGGTQISNTHTVSDDQNQNSMAVGVVEAPGYRFNMPKGVTPIFDNYRGSSKKKIIPPHDTHSNREFDLAVKAVSEDVEAKFITNANIGATTTQLKSAVELLIQAQQQQQKDLAERSSGVIEMTHSNPDEVEGLSDKITRLQDDLKPVNPLVAAFKLPTHQRELPKLPRASSFSDSKGLGWEAIQNLNDVPLAKVDNKLNTIIDKMVTMNGNYTWISPRKHGSEEQCQPSRDIVFSKTHKTGGTTVTNMLLRHAEKRGLSVGLPIEQHWELAGYPASFDPRLIDPQQDTYNILCHHMRFDKDRVANVVNAAAQYVTILRDPITNFESSFGFFKDYPFPQWQGKDRTIEEFLEQPKAFYNKSTPWYFRAKNYMSYDLGFDHENDSDEYIKHVISQMETTYKFIMITDRYEESIILLKDLLCLDDSDIVYLPLKVRTQNERKRVSSDTAFKIKRWNRLDTAIYEYFSRRFDQLAESYGRERLNREVQILRERLKDVETRCVDDYDTQSLAPWIKRIKLRKKSGAECQRLIWGEVKYADHLRQIQRSMLTRQELEKQPNLVSQHELLHEVQKTVLGNENSLYNDLSQ